DGVEQRVKEVQDAFMRVRYCAKPVVAAIFARTIAGGCELALHAARIVAASETYMGLVEVAVGLVPGAGGCKELVRRHITDSRDPVPDVQKIMQTIGMA